VDGEEIELTPEDVGVERKVKEGLIASTNQGMTVVLDTALTEELEMEGMARELVNKINTMRRDENYDVSDRIVLKLKTTPRVQRAFEKHREYICHEVLATTFSFEPCDGSSWDINGEPAVIHMQKKVNLS
jgi:isoleucyl-tRNA synthetase